MAELAMQRLKTGWATVVLGDVAINSTVATQTPEDDGFTRYIIGKHIPGDGSQITTWGEVGDGEFGSRIRTIIKPGDIVCTTRGPKLRVAIATFNCLSAHTNFILRTKDSKVLLQEFLQALACSEPFQEHLRRNFRGSTNLFVNWSDAAKFEFVLPPIEEQRRLTNALSGADNATEALRSLVISMGTLRQSLIDTLTDSETTTTIGEHCKMQNGRPFPGNEYCDEGVLLLRPGNLGVHGYLDWSSEKTKRVPDRYLSEAKDFLLREGDVVINLTAQSLEDGFMGRTCLVTGDEPSLLNQRIGRFYGFSNVLLPEFLFRCLQSSRFKRNAVSMCEGSKIKHLFWEHLDRFELPALDVDRQRDLCQQLRQLDEQLEKAEARVAGARKIKGHLLREVTGADPQGVA